jgi:diadenosine tetraphosphate (Ap4A) HIT family hydrolase
MGRCKENQSNPEKPGGPDQYHAAMTTAIHRAVEAARRGENPCVITRVASGWVVLGDPQVLRGYCLLLPDPVVSDLNAMNEPERALFLRDMSRLGDALLRVTACKRINYEILGNLEPALHAHVVPRYADEPPDHRSKPVWTYDWSKASKFDTARDGALMHAIAEAVR